MPSLLIFAMIEETVHRIIEMFVSPEASVAYTTGVRTPRLYTGIARSNQDPDLMWLCIVGQQAVRLWHRLKKPARSPSSDNSSDGTDPSALNSKLILHFCAMLEGYSNVLGTYCNSLQTQGLLHSYKWKDPGEITAASPYLRAKEMMDIIQSREYQVKFCHANISHRQKTSSEVKPEPVNGSASGSHGNLSNGRASWREAELCTRSTDKRSVISKLILVVGIIIVILLIVAVILIIILRS